MGLCPRPPVQVCMSPREGIPPLDCEPRSMTERTKPILRGELITLRPPKESDKKERLSYGRHPEYRRMVGADARVTPPLTVEEVDHWYEESCANPFTWVIDLDGRCIGVARLNRVDEHNRRARYTIGIFDPEAWGKGYGTNATRLVLGYAFEVLKLHRVELRVLDFNERAIRCYEKSGFVREGIEREGSLIAGEWRNDVLMGILEQDYYSRT